jgi:hypothetical protein
VTTARAVETVVVFRHETLERPVVLVIERTLPNGQPDVQIVLRKAPEEHLSLHREDDGGLLLTHSSPGKPSSVWDEVRIRVARALDYRDPEKHGTYYQHHRIYPMTNVEGYHLVGKLIDLGTVTAKPKYAQLPHVMISAPAASFMLHVNLTTPAQLLAPSEPRVSTAFGDLYFRTGPPLTLAES